MNLLKLAKANRRSFFLLLWMGTVPLIVSSVITYFALSYESFFRGMENWQWGILFGLSIISMGFALTPTTFVALFTGFFLGIDAVLPMSVAYLLASYIGFQLAHVTDKGVFLNTLHDIPKARRFIELMQGRQFGLIVLSRISPVLPFAVMNVLLSVIGTKLGPFLVAGFIGMLPRTILFIWIGSKAQELQNLMTHGTENQWEQISFIILLIVSIAGFYFYLKGLLTKMLEKEQE